MKRVTYCDLNKKQDRLLGCDGEPLPCNAKVLQCDDLPDPVTPTPSADLAVVKGVSPTKAAPGGAVVYTVVATNAGPDAANGALVSDNILSNYLDATSATPVTITYSGGAAGPATTTVGALATGVAITTFPMGGVATFSIPTTVKAGAPAAQIVNTASIVPPTGVEDPKPGNNNSAAVVDVEQCYLKCTDELIKYSDPTAASGFGICFVGPSTNREFLWPGTPPVPGLGRLTFTVVNPFPTQALVECDMFVRGNLMGDPGTGYTTFFHYVGVDDDIDPTTDPYLNMGASAPTQSNFVFTNASLDQPRDAGWGGTENPNESGNEETGTCFYRQVLPAGGSQVLHAFWKHNTLTPQGGNVIFHAGYKIHVKISRMGGI